MYNQSEYTIAHNTQTHLNSPSAQMAVSSGRQRMLDLRQDVDARTRTVRIIRTMKQSMLETLNSGEHKSRQHNCYLVQ